MYIRNCEHNYKALESITLTSVAFVYFDLLIGIG